ncbi:MAG TPA: hypothetical protein VJ728_00825, partial [Candidatus Binataceae bacterium]|nr:hypothetical protein [Candidatus Binataceae bacterium]
HALELCEHHQFVWLAEWTRCVLGDTRSRLGRLAEGTALIRRGIAGLFDIGVRGKLSEFTAYLAAALDREGATGDALETVEQALQLNSDEIYYRPETLRVRGEIQRKLGHVDLAESDFRSSIELAQRMGAKAWELRTTMSLARLLKSQCRGPEARSMLTQVFNSLMEGFDTADQTEAKLLLDELSR